MKTNILLPQKIRVGFNKRSDTYNGHLAYVIYYDEKNKLRKEKSWESWRDKNIDPVEYDNVPTSGFVLNKKVGGYKSDWNVRQTYARVYDPRGFEFEITVPNLLYILENTNCIKGKGLEGDFVYTWDGTELVLLPTSAPEYAEIIAFTDMVKNKERINKKNIVLGGRYKDNKNVEWIYMGYFDVYGNGYNGGRWVSEGVALGKRHVFWNDLKNNDVNDWRSYRYHHFQHFNSLSKFVKAVSTEPVENYAELMDELEGTLMYSPYDSTKDKYELITNDNLEAKFNTPDAVGLTVYFDYNGIKLTGHLRKYRHADVTQYPEYYPAGAFLESIQRTNPIERRLISDSIWRQRYGPDHEFETIEKELVDAGMLRKNRIMGTKVLPSLTELNDKLKFTYKREFLANGKEKR